jgi:sphingomyelin phosphodiesterase
VWTGDNPPHDVWNQSEASQESYLGYTAELIAATFNDTDVEIYPSIGNHGVFPVNVLDFDNDEWITSYLAKAWAPFLPKSSLQ